MLSASPHSANHVVNCLPTRKKVCNFHNRRVNLNNLLQTNELGVRCRSIGTADELPAMIIRVVGDQKDWF